MSFCPFPKIARFSRDIIITEKIDGTNAGINIMPETPGGEYPLGTTIINGYVLEAQSKSRTIYPLKGQDNAGFAHWASENAATLLTDLGEGLHFGEWFGQGIQRGYGLETKQFALFNTTRWGNDTTNFITPGLVVVPVLYKGPWFAELGTDPVAQFAPTYFLNRMRFEGSEMCRGFMKPEGIVIYHDQGKIFFKITLEHDEKGKDFGA